MLDDPGGTSAKTQVSLTRFLQSEVKIIHIIVQNNTYYSARSRWTKQQHSVLVFVYTLTLTITKKLSSGIAVAVLTRQFSYKYKFTFFIVTSPVSTIHHRTL